MEVQFDFKFSIEPFTVYVFKTGRWKQNSYVIHDTSEAKIFLVDPGGEADKIINLVNQLSGKVVSISLTHAHHDHVGALKRMCDHFQLNFYMHEGDYKLLRRAPFYALTFEARKMEIPLTGQLFFTAENTSTVGQDFKFIHTPGHTIGGVVIHNEKIAFTGDTLLNKMIGRTDLPGSSLEKLSDSITTFLNSLGDDVMLFPGHGQPWRVAEAKKWWSANMVNTPEYREEVDE
ncbi:MAG: MBL fold metallo-hydrolase [Bacteriovoracaceae bacterium]